MQGGSFAYLTPTAAITMAIKNSRDWNDAPDGTNHERFLVSAALRFLLPYLPLELPGVDQRGTKTRAEMGNKCCSRQKCAARPFDDNALVRNSLRGICMRCR